MNLLLLEPADFISDSKVTLGGRRLQHLLEVHRVSEGTSLRAGLVNGQMGEATVLRLTPQAVELAVALDQPPPPALPVTLILAMPRPKMLRRILQTIATMGVKQLYLINSWRVEKSYWQSPWLAPGAVHEQLLLGLEQGCDTQLPRVLTRSRFKPFVEDELPDVVAGSLPLVAHPGGGTPCPVGPLSSPVTIAIGPEGGFIDYEIDKLCEAGFQPVTLGSRILRVETAIPVILGRLFY
jgi:RsmE family RNA methyltransferase